MPVIAQFHFCPVFDGGGVTRFDVLPLSFHDGERIIEILLYDVFTTGVVFSQKRVQMFLTVSEGHTVMARQIAGAIARRIVTYAEVGEDCYIDEHMGFIKFGSRVDVYLPLGTEVCVKMGQATVGNDSLIL